MRRNQQKDCEEAIKDLREKLGERSIPEVKQIKCSKEEGTMTWIQMLPMGQ